MYRIEFEPGDVGVFRSVEELATAVKSGVITSRARIYHQASDKWLPIEFHPHYRKALELVASGNVPTTPPHPRPAIQPTAVTHHATEPMPEPTPMPAPMPAPVPGPVAVAEPEAATPPPAIAEPAAEPVVASAATVAPEVAVAEPATAEPEPLEIFVPPRSREIHFIPVDDPAPPRLARAVYLERLAPLPISSEPTLALEAPVSTLPLPDAGESRSTEAAPAGDAFYTPEESARPAFGPRFRLSRRPSRPIAIAIGGAALILSTHMGLSAAAPWTRDVMTAGLTSLSLGRGDAAAPTAERVAPAPAGAALVTRVHQPEAQGSPSFGASSAFTPAHAAMQPPAKREVPPEPERPLMSAQLGSAAGAGDSIVKVSSLAREIAVAVPKIPGLAPAVNGKLTPAVLVTRYEAAYAAAREDLETGVRTAGFANLFAPEHLASSQGVRSARLAAGTASAYIAKYRRREAEIEAAYADSANTIVKSPADRRAWDSRHVLKESPETAKLASFLLQEIDSVFGVLSSQDGAYELRDDSIVFQDAAAARAYAELRPWLDRRAHQWADTASGAPSTATQVLRAMGTTRLPEGGAF